MTSYMTAAATIAVTGALTVAGAHKLARPAGTSAMLGKPAALTLGVLELVLGFGVAFGLAMAQWAGAGLLAVFTAWLSLALARGRQGAPCPCFGGRSRIGWASLGRTASLFGLALLIAVSPAPALSTAGWLAVVVFVLGVGLVATGLVAVALAREVARLRAARGALEIDGEGPAIGAPSPLIERFEAPAGPISVAVFVSPGCRMCQELGPAVEALASELTVVIFDEQRDPLAWEVSDVPGSPFAVAMDRAGIVLAKGTFNTAEQLRSVPATALYRLGSGAAHV
jgi:Methylamine utilisation protein MauE